MQLELGLIELISEAEKLADCVRVPLDGTPDGREGWFETWVAKAKA
jgi:hypothetical protein